MNLSPDNPNAVTDLTFLLAQLVGATSRMRKLQIRKSASETMTAARERAAAEDMVDALLGVMLPDAERILKASQRT